MANRTAESIYSAARRNLVAGRLSKAVEDLEDALRDEPNEARLWALLGVAQWELGEVADAISSLETALTLAPLGPEGRLALALGYEVIQKRDLARDLFVGIAQEERLPYGILEPLARALARAKRPGMALEVCARAAAHRPKAPEPLRGMAFYMARMGAAPAEILPVLYQAFHLDPTDFDTRLLLARRLSECGRAGAAAELLAVIDVSTSRCPRCLNAMREVFVEAGDADNAARCIEALTALGEPSDPHAPHPDE